MTTRSIDQVAGHTRIDGVVPGVRGQRAFHTRELDIIDPFVILDHIGPETLTMIFEGLMYHVDSAGNRETLATGSTQNMIAGSGIQHGGDMTNDPDTGVFHEVQLWVNMPAATKMQPPSIDSAHAGDKPIIDFGHYSAEVVTGELFGAASPLSTTQPTRIARIRTTGRGPITIDGISRGWTALVFVLCGSILAADRELQAYETAVFDTIGGTVALTATDEPADLLFLAGRPIGEPVAMGGPFVMNTQDEIRRAEADFRAGRFGTVDGPARLT